MSSVERASRAQIPAVVSMSKAFHAEAGESGAFDASRVSVFLLGLVTGSRGALFLARDEGGQPIGFLAAMYGENYLTGQRMAEETAIYVRPESRGGQAAGQLYDAFERWAIDERGAVRLRVTAQTSLRPEVVGRWFARRGFKEVERSFTKEVLD